MNTHPVRQFSLRMYKHARALMHIWGSLGGPLWGPLLSNSTDRLCTMGYLRLSCLIRKEISLAQGVIWGYLTLSLGLSWVLLSYLWGPLGLSWVIFGVLLGSSWIIFGVLSDYHWCVQYKHKHGDLVFVSTPTHQYCQYTVASSCSIKYNMPRVNWMWVARRPRQNQYFDFIGIDSSNMKIHVSRYRLHHVVQYMLCCVLLQVLMLSDIVRVLKMCDSTVILQCENVTS